MTAFAIIITYFLKFYQYQYDIQQIQAATACKCRFCCRTEVAIGLQQKRTIMRTFSQSIFICCSPDFLFIGRRKVFFYQTENYGQNEQG